MIRDGKELEKEKEKEEKEEVVKERFKKI